MLRVVVLLTLASLVWVPIAVWIGLRPRVAERVQPAAQFLAAFPANVVFPIAVVGILTFHLDPDIWLSFLIIFGTQWYIVFNVIAGASAFPNDLREAAANFRITGWTWWFKRDDPGHLPLLRHRGAHGLGRLLERRHRGRIRAVGERQGLGHRHRRLYRPGHRGRRLPQASCSASASCRSSSSSTIACCGGRCSAMPSVACASAESPWAKARVPWTVKTPTRGRSGAQARVR